MKSIVKKVLDTVRPYKGAPIHAVKGDYNSRFINAVICTEGVPVKAEKSNAVTVTFETAEASRTFPGIVNDDGSVEVPIVAWALENEGDVWCYISVSTEESSLTTMGLLIEVHDRGNVGGEIAEDDPEYDDILVILARLSDHDVRISQTEKSVEKALQLTSRNDKRITNMEARINPSLLLVDDSVSYAKPVPENALPNAEITKVGGMTYKNESNQTLQSSIVKRIRSAGINLLEFPYEEMSATRSGVTWTANEDGGVSGSGLASQATWLTIYNNFPLSRGKLYVSLFGDYTNMKVVVALIDGNTGTDVATLNILGINQSIDVSKYPTATRMRVRIYRDLDGAEISGTCYPLISNSPIEEYVPCTGTAFEMPAAVQALEGYGEGNPDDPNEYNAVIWRDDGMRIYSHKGNIIDGAWVPLATPKIIDISDLLPDDNYIGVEENGTIFMENQFGQDVPSTIEFQLKEVQA